MKKRRIRYDRLTLLIVLFLLMCVVCIFLFSRLVAKVSPNNRINLIKPQESKVIKLSNSSKEQEVKKVEQVQTITLEQRINKYLEDAKIDLSRISILVRDLQANKIIFSHHPKKKFVAASLYKLPLSMVVYDAVHQQKLSLNLKIPLEEIEFDAVDLSQISIQNNQISVEQLVKASLVFSDNGSSLKLIELFGGWRNFTNKASLYSTNVKYNEITKDDNFTNAMYMDDVLATIWKNQTQYTNIIQYLKNANRSEYLDFNFKSVPIAQKYGEYDGFVNVAGIVYTKRPFSIVILTDAFGSYSAQRIMGELNDLCIKSFNS